MRYGVRLLGPGVLLGLLVGCGSSCKPSGKVTLRGEPIAGAELIFRPVATPDAPIIGLSGSDGAYRLDYAGKSGVPTGKCRVVVTHYTLPNGKPLPGGEEGAALKSGDKKVVRTVYSFERDLAAGASTQDFELSEGKLGAE